MKNQKILSAFLLSDVGGYLGDEPFSSNLGKINLHPTKGTHWVVYINKIYYDSYGCRPPNNLARFIMKRK